jgi:hypothetical protein
MNFNAHGERGYTSTVVVPDEYTDIHAVGLSDTRATVYVGSVEIHADRASLDRLHEAVTVAYELLSQRAIDAGVLA